MDAILAFNELKFAKKFSFDQISSRTVANRTLLTSQFISSHKLEPVGLSWCQVEWDESVSETCRRLAGKCLTVLISYKDKCKI